MSERRQTIVLDTGGDVKLVVGKEGSAQQPIQASRGAMSLASPVWKAMFNRVWAEHDASEIALPEDNVEATLLVLRIAHLRFHELPKKGALGLEALVDLAVICDKYDLVHVIRPFLDLNTGHNPAWTFGYSSNFQALANWAVRHMTVRFCTPMISGKLIPQHMPPGLVERITTLRLEAIESILVACYGNLDQVLKGPLCKQTPPAEINCRCMILGSYTSFLIAKGLYPQRKLAVDITMCVQDLSNLFSALKIHTYESHDYKALEEEMMSLRNRSPYSRPEFTRDKFVGHGITEHKACGEVLNIATRAEQICSQIPSPVLDEHRAHMAAQAKK